MERENIDTLLELAERLLSKNPVGSIEVYGCILHFFPNNKKALEGVVLATEKASQKPTFLNAKRKVLDVFNKLFHKPQLKGNLAGAMALAKSQERQHPFDAYLLYRTIQKIEPDVFSVGTKITEYEKTYGQNMILAFREDGLCQRVIAILLGYFLSKHLGFEFRFIWPHTGLLKNAFDLEFGAGHSVRTDVFQILSTGFVGRHLLSKQGTKMIWNVIPTGRPLHFRVTFRRLEQLKRNRDIIRPCWRATGCTSNGRRPISHPIQGLRA